MEIILAQPRGFCAGVIRAISMVERLLEAYGPPLYVRHEIVHNRRVIDDLKARGVIFVSELDAVPPGARVVFSAHGVAKAVEQQASDFLVEAFDATCPLVKKVHNQAISYAKQKRALIIVGHENHPEVVGTKGQVDAPVFVVSSPQDVAALPLDVALPVAYVTQTTLSIDDTAEVIKALEERFVDLEGPSLSDICYATQNRQAAVKELLHHVDVLLVVGSSNSSNSNRLRDLAADRGVAAYLVNGADQVQQQWLMGRSAVGITAGASAPEVVVQEVIAAIQGWFPQAMQRTLEGREENVVFKLPATIATLSGESIKIAQQIL